MNGQEPQIDRRNPYVPDRRGLPRGGRRETDLPFPVTCVRCLGNDVRALGRVPRGIWCECRACGRVWPLETPGIV